MGSATTRREFLETTTGLVISFALPWRADATVVRAAAPPPFAPNAWLRIGTDGTVTLTIDRSEMGQGAQTGLAIILAEELEADWSTIRLGPMPENPAGWSRIMRTGGSNAIRSSWEPLRKAGATAREMLLTADRAKAMPGVRHVVALEPSSWMGANGAWAAGCAAGVAVVADTYWQALQARRGLEPDFVSEAVRVSQAAGVPVKVVWTREDDMRNGFYRPTTYNRFSAGLDASGRLVAWT